MNFTLKSQEGVCPRAPLGQATPGGFMNIHEVASGGVEPFGNAVSHSTPGGGAVAFGNAIFTLPLLGPM